MQRKVNKVKARNSARKLAKEFGYNKAPLDLFSLLDFLDIECIEFDPATLNLKDTDPETISAFIDYRNTRILYNKYHSINRIRFSIAHELGHYQLNHKSFPQSSNYNSVAPDELEANIFAAEILMPNYLLENELTSTSEDIQKLAIKFQVSYEAAKLRIMYDDKIMGNSFDYMGDRSETKKKELDFETNLFSGYYPPTQNYIDNFDDALEHYGEYPEDDLIDLFNWIVKNDEQDSYPETFNAIKKLIEGFSDEE